MRLTTLNKIKTSTKKVSVFGGYNHSELIAENEWLEMLNMSGDNFPALSPRRPRGVVKPVSKANGLFAKEELVYVDGTSLYYGSEKVATVSDSEKQFVSMGAYLIVMPDKIAYNVSTGEVKHLENEWVAPAGTTITYSSTNWTGGEVSSSDEETYTYVKIAANGINVGFAQYDGVEITGCTQANLNKTAILYEVGAGYVIIIGDVESTFTQTGGLSLKRKMPDMDYLCESENRVWGCKDNEIYACKLGDPTNWACYEGITSDSMAISVGSDGDFTGCVNYNGYVLFFKEEYLHKLYGSKPSNYQVTTTAMRGIERGSEKSLCIVNEVLYYKSRDGILAYSGGVPQKISDQLGPEPYRNAVAAGVDSKYYVSMEDSRGEKSLFVYDTAKSIWCREDDADISAMVYCNGNIYYLDETDKQICTIYGDDEGSFPWSVVSGPLTENDLDRKYLKSINFRAWMEAGSFIEILTRYDNDPEWRREALQHCRHAGQYIIPVYPNRYDTMRLCIRGRGQVKIYQMDRIIEKGSEV